MAFDVLLVDDHKIMRDGIKAILSRADDFRVSGEAENGADAVHFVKQHKPAMVLLDIGLPDGLNGVETTTEILRAHPDCKVVILSMFDDENSVVSAIRRDLAPAPAPRRRGPRGVRPRRPRGARLRARASWSGRTPPAPASPRRVVTYRK